MKVDSEVNVFRFNHPDIWESVSAKRFESQVFFIENLFERFSPVRRILDVGCGTGAHIARLCSAETNRKGVGIDLHPGMIEFGQNKYTNVDLSVKDIRSINYSDEFDALLCLDQVFGYNQTNADIIKTLSGFSRSLKSKGILLVELFNPIIYIAGKPFNALSHDIRDYQQFHLISHLKQEVDVLKQTMKTTRTISSLDDQQVIQVDMNEYRLLFPQEFIYYLNTTGFEVIEFYGSYNLEHTKLDDMMMLCLARKTDSTK